MNASIEHIVIERQRRRFQFGDLRARRRHIAFRFLFLIQNVQNLLPLGLDHRFPRRFHRGDRLQNALDRVLYRSLHGRVLILHAPPFQHA